MAFTGVILVYLVFGYAYTLTFDGRVDTIPDVIYDVQYLPDTIYANSRIQHLRQDERILIAAYLIGTIRMITVNQAQID